MSDQENEEEDFNGWLDTFSDYVNPEDGRLYVIRKPDDIIQVSNDLEEMLGD